MGMRFYNLLTEDIRTELVRDDDNATIIINFRHPELDADHFYQEFWMVIWHRLASWICGTPIPLIETAFTQAQPQHAPELLLMFPGIQKFGARTNALTISVGHLDLPLVRNKLEVEAFLLQSPYNLLTIPGHDRSLKKQVANLASSSASGGLSFPSLQSAAAQLNMSQQTLHRRLRDEGTNFQKIKDDVRRDLALALLARDRRPVYEVAEALGFADARSLTRAFKNWTGMTPREYCRFL